MLYGTMTSLLSTMHICQIPVAEEDDGFLEKRRQNVFMLLTIYILIDQYEGQQMFMQQAIDALLELKIVEKPTLDDG